MKRLSIALLLIGGVSSACSQTFNEWFKQKKTQTEYLLQQVAALHVYISYAQKGYQIVNKGLTTIGEIKDGHLNLDKAFFRALHIVSTTVKEYDKISAVVLMELEVLAQYRMAIQQTSNSGQYTRKEQLYIQKTFVGVISYCTAVLDDLMAVTMDNVLQMSDDERLRRIDHLHNEMKDVYVFAMNLKNQCGIMAFQRAKDEQDVRLLKKLNAIPN